MVQFPKVEVGATLAGKVADRDALPKLAARYGMAGDPRDQRCEPHVVELSPPEALEHFVVDAFKESKHVAQGVLPMPSAELPDPPDSSARALAPEACVSGLDLFAFHDRVRNRA